LSRECCDFSSEIRILVIAYFLRSLFFRLGKKITKKIAKLIGKILLKSVLVVVDGPLPIGDIIFLLWALWDIGVFVWSDIPELKKEIGKLWEKYKKGTKKFFEGRMIDIIFSGVFDCFCEKPRCCRLAKARLRRVGLREILRLRKGWKGKTPLTASLAAKRLAKRIKDRVLPRVQRCCR